MLSAELLIYEYTVEDNTIIIELSKINRKQNQLLFNYLFDWIQTKTIVNRSEMVCEVIGCCLVMFMKRLNLD